MEALPELNQKQVEHNLREYSIDLKKLQTKCDKIKQKITKYKTPEDIAQKVLQLINYTKNAYGPLDLKITTSIECYILTKLHDIIIPIFYEAFKEEDELIFKKCILLQYVQFNHELRGVQLPASIVELASLDAHKTVHEKVTCIMACYDCLFAELKFAMIELIAERGESSENRVDIPIVNNSDVVRVLIEVIVRAKCKHLYSNLYFVQSLGDIHLNDEKCQQVLMCFNTAIEELTQMDDDFVRTHRRTRSDMDLKQYNSIIQRLDNASISNNFERFSLTRLTKQISKSHDMINK